MASENVNIKTNLDSSGAESGLKRLKAKFEDLFNNAKRNITSFFNIKRQITETVNRKVTETVESSNGTQGAQEFEPAMQAGKILVVAEALSRLFNTIAEKLNKLSTIYKKDAEIFGNSAESQRKAVGYEITTSIFKTLQSAVQWAGVGAVAGSAIGGAIGTALAGPVGTAAGAVLGAKIGGAIGATMSALTSLWDKYIDSWTEDNETADKRFQEIQEGRTRQLKVQKNVNAASKAMERQIALRNINEDLEDDKKDIDDLVTSGNVDELYQRNYKARQNVEKLTKKRNALEQAFIDEASREGIAAETRAYNQAKIQDELGLVNARLTAATQLNAYATAGINTAKENAAKQAEKDAKRQAQLDKEAARQAAKDAKAEKKSEIDRLRDEYKAKMDEYRDKTKEFNEQVSIREDYINLVNGIRDMVSSSFSQIGGSVGPQYEVLSRLGNNEENLLKKFKDDTTSKLEKIHEAAETINNTIKAKQNEPAVLG